MLQSISKDILDFKTKGRLVIGGDFNARCGVNGDPVIRTAGRRLMEFCAAQKLCMLNKNGMTIGKYQLTLKRVEQHLMMQDLKYAPLWSSLLV